MLISELLPFLDLPDLIHFYQLNQYCNSLMKPGHPRCLRFDVLFSRQKTLMETACHGWQEKIIQAQEPHNSFAFIMKTAFECLYLTPSPRYMSRVPQKLKTTYQRWNKELQTREIMGYGAESGTMNQNNFDLVPASPDSAFGKKMLRLRSVCWMDPKAFIEGIPASWSSIEVAIYHAYLPQCKM